MNDIIDIRGRIHEANVQRIATKVLYTVGASPHEDDIVRASIIRWMNWITWN